MRLAVPAVLAFVSLALAGPAAALPLAAPADAGGVVAQAAGPADVPEVVGHARLVERAASFASQPLAPDELAAMAAEQQLRAALDSARPLVWRLNRFVPQAPELPLASVIAAPAAPPRLVAGPVGAVAVAVALASVLSVAMPQLPFLPFYSRIQREEAMLNARRSQLYEVVRAEPGIHLSDLVRRSGLGWGAALYHLSVLEKNRMLVAHDEGGFKRYFANGMHRPAEMQRLVALRHGAAKALFDTVVAAPGRSGRELAEHLRLSPSTLARASERLEEAGLVRRVRAGRRVLYFPAEQPAVATPVAVAA